MPLDYVVFALVGLAVGAGAALLLPRLFRTPRILTMLTGVASAVLAGGLARVALGTSDLLTSVPIALIGACLLVSVLAKTDRRSQGIHPTLHASP
jgi:uncharacterized membrane protein YeaQ/YmgE (transglycosylase-associated protein family)